MFQYWADDQRESVVFSFHLVWLFYEACRAVRIPMSCSMRRAKSAPVIARTGTTRFYDLGTGSRRLPMKPPRLATT